MCLSPTAVASVPGPLQAVPKLWKILSSHCRGRSWLHLSPASRGTAPSRGNDPEPSQSCPDSPDHPLLCAPFFGRGLKAH